MTDDLDEPRRRRRNREPQVEVEGQPHAAHPARVPASPLARATMDLPAFRSHLGDLLASLTRADGEPVFLEVSQVDDGSVFVALNAPGRQGFRLHAVDPLAQLPTNVEAALGWVCDHPACGAWSADAGMPLYRCPGCRVVTPGDQLPITGITGLAGQDYFSVGDLASEDDVDLDAEDWVARTGVTADYIPVDPQCSDCGGLGLRIVSPRSCIECGLGAVSRAAAVVCPECGLVLGAEPEGDGDGGADAS